MPVRPQEFTIILDEHPEDPATMQAEGLAFGKHGGFDPRAIIVREAGGGIQLNVQSCKEPTNGEAPVQLRLSVGEWEELACAIQDVCRRAVQRRAAPEVFRREDILMYSSP